MSARSERPTAAPRDVQVKDPAASMAVIFDMMRNPIDPAYADAAHRREVEGGMNRSSSSLLLVVAVTLIGLLIGVAAHALRVPRSVAADRHSQLVHEVNSRQQKNDSLGTQISTIRGEIATAQGDALTHEAKSTLKNALDAAGKSSGMAATSGGGFVMKVSDTAPEADSADSDPRTGADAAVTSTDLQQLVNGWWQAGASAISINGQRITSMSAIRFAGSAVLVNFRPLTTPYEISVIAPKGAQSRFDASFAGSYAAQLRKGGFDIATTSSSSLELPALASVQISHAVPVKH